MSVKIMGAVWEAALPQNEKLVLLAYADHASHDGSNVYPSQELIAWKTGYSRRSVNRISNSLIKKEILKVVKKYGGRGRVNIMAIHVDKIPKLPPIVRQNGVDMYDKGGVGTVSGTVTSIPDGIHASAKKKKEEPGSAIKKTDSVIAEKKVKGKGDRQPKPVAAKKRKPTPHQRMVMVLCEVMNVDAALNFPRYSPFAKKLLTGGYTADQVAAHYGEGGWWYLHDWRGRRGDAPSEYHIKDTIKTAVEFKEAPREGINVW